MHYCYGVLALGQICLFLTVFGFNWRTNLFKVIILSNIVLILISKAQLVSPRPHSAQ